MLRYLGHLAAIRHWPVIRIIVGAISRAMARDVMLFAGGASFFGMLALFPAVALAISVYGLIFNPEDAERQIQLIAGVIPEGAQDFWLGQMSRIAEAPLAALSTQGLLALTIALFAASRGAKALIAGLNHLAEDRDIRNVLHFNFIAMVSVLLGGILLAAAQLGVLVVPVFLHNVMEGLGLEPFDFGRVFNEWTTVSFAMFAALALLYRLAMRRRSDAVSWASSLLAAAASTTLWYILSRGFSIYVSQVIDFSLYGSLGALVVFLLWIYWSAYAVFFGGALAIELDAPRDGRGEGAAPGD